MSAMDVTRGIVEDFVFAEADLLDRWEIRRWLELFTADCQYLVPAAGLAADAHPDSSLFYIADDRVRLEQRIERLSKKTGHSEWPRSKTRHCYTNVRVTGRYSDTVTAALNFICYRTKDQRTDMYCGQTQYVLVVDHDDRIRIREKRCALDLDGLSVQGRITILL